MYGLKLTNNKFFMFKIVFKILFIFYLSINISYAEIVKSIDIKGNSRVNSETIKMFVNVKIGDDLTSNDLNKALNENLIFGAGLDVFEKEPPSQDNPLLKNNKAFLSPHSAVFTEECLSRMGIETIQNVIDFFENKLDNSKIVKI